MYEDEIIAEVWRNRESYAKRHHHSLQEIVADLQTRQETPFSRLVDRRHRTEDSTSPSQGAASEGM